MALLSKVGQFTAIAGTGNQSVTGVGFQPKAIMFWVTEHTSNGSITNSRMCRGFTDGTRQASSSVAWNNGTNTVRTLVTDTACIVLTNGVGTITTRATLVSFGVDGFTVNWTTSGASRIVSYMALGGTSLTNVYVGSRNASGTPVIVSEPGFQPDIIFFQGGQQAAVNTSNNRGGFLSGVAKSISDRHCVSARESTSGTGFSGYTTDQPIVPADNSSTPTVRYDLGSLTLTGFTLVRDLGTATVYFIYMALQGVSSARGILNQPSTTGNQIISGLSFSPSVVIFEGGDKTTTNGWATEPELVHGAMDSASQFAIWLGRNGTSANTYKTNTGVIYSRTAGGIPTTQAVAASGGLNFSGFTLNWTTADASARKIAWTALGPTEAVSSSSSSVSSSSLSSSSNSSSSESSSSSSKSSSFSSSSSSFSSSSSSRSSSSSISSSSSSQFSSSSSSVSSSSSSVSSSSSSESRIPLILDWVRLKSSSSSSVSSSSTSSSSSSYSLASELRLTEDGFVRITESGEIRVTQ